MVHLTGAILLAAGCGWLGFQAAEGLRLAGRLDLIGFGPKCLLRPDRGKGQPSHSLDKQRTARKKTIRNIHKKKNAK